MDSLLTWVRRAAPDGRPDAELLAAFLADHDERAFAEVVRRHGPVVWGACRRLLPDPADAEDAFQATFLVLVRRGDRPPAPLGPWLYRVAVLTARGVRRRNARRLARARPLPDDVAAPAAPDPPELDALLQRMPERYRAAVVLCYLEGLTEREAANRVGCPVGTLSARVSRGLAWLRARSVADPRAALAAAAAVSAPAATAAAAVRTAVVVRAAVAQLATEVSRTMVLTKLCICLTTLSATLLAAAAGVAALARPADRSDPRPADIAGKGEPPVNVGGKTKSGAGNGPPAREVAMPTGKVRPGIHALTAARASVIVANGGKDPVRLGSTTGTGGGSLHVWDWSQSPRSRVVPGVEFWGTERAALTPDGQALVLARGLIVDLQSGRQAAIDLGGESVRLGEAIYSRIGDMRFSPDGGRLALLVTHLDDQQPGRIKGEAVQIVAFPGGRQLCEFPAGESYALRIAFAADGKHVVSADREGNVSLRDSATGKVLQTFAPALKSQVMGVAISPDGRQVAATQREPGDVYIWEGGSGKLAHRIPGESLRKLGGHDPGYGALRFAPDGKHLAAAYWGRLFVFDSATGEVAAALREGSATDLRWSGDSKTVTAVTPVTVGPPGPEGHAASYPEAHEWEWRGSKLVPVFGGDDK